MSRMHYKVMAIINETVYEEKIMKNFSHVRAINHYLKFNFSFILKK